MQVLASGTQTIGALNTDYTLYDDIGTGSNIYVVIVDTANLDYGDTVVIEIYTKVLGTGAVGLISSGSYTNKQVDPIKISVPIPSDQGIKVVINQTEGTARSFDWKVLAI